MHYFVKPIIQGHGGKMYRSFPSVYQHMTAAISGRSPHNCLHRHAINDNNGSPGHGSFTSTPVKYNICQFSNYPVSNSKLNSSRIRLDKDCVNMASCTVSSLYEHSTKRKTARINTFNQHDFSTICTQKDHRRFSIPNHPLSTRCLNPITGNTQFHREFSLSPQKILEASPPSIQPYLRLIRFDKPIGSLLLFWPCSWSIAMATLPGHLPSLSILFLFGAGAFMMRGAGCIINDMWDRDFDQKVERTKLRPLASGELNFFQGLSLLGAMLSGSLAILLMLNNYTILLGASSMILVILYPLAKRYTNWPQLMLGLTFNLGALMGWSAVVGDCNWAVVLPLYASCILWTLFYDTVYAHQDKYDDMFIGVKSTALYLGDKTKPWLTGFGASMIGLLTLSGYMSDQTWPFYIGVSSVAAHLAHQLYTVDLNDADSCAEKFISNTRLGFVMFMAILLGTLMKYSNEEEKSLSSKS